MARTQTAEKTFIFDLNPTNEGSVNVDAMYIDIAQVHSLVNRVFARQGYEYVVQNLEIGCQPGGQYSATIMRLPEHWPCINAWEKGMRLWLEQQNEVVDDSGLESTVARYRDFKVGFDADHDFANNAIPDGFFIEDAASTVEQYEWARSQVVIPNDGAPGNTTERALHMIGVDVGTNAGLIKAYAESRSRPQGIDPNIVDVPTGGLFGEMFDVGMDDELLVDNIQDRNNEPPYLVYRHSADNAYPGAGFQGTYYAQTQDVLGVNAGQNYNTDSTGSFVAPCGLLKISINGVGVSVPTPQQAGVPPWGLWLKLTLAPGPYKGLLAQSMQEAN